MKALFCIGSSHIWALFEGHNARVRAGKAAGFNTWKQIGTGPYFRGNEAELTTSEVIDTEFAAIMSEVEVSAVFLCCGGGEHTTIALFNIWPFDVYIPGEDPLHAIPANCEIIPYDVMLATCAFYVSLVLPFVQRVRSLSSLPMYHILPPPPPASDEYMKVPPGSHFAELVAKHGITPAPLRQKIWRLCCTAVRQIYENMGILVIEPPAEALDEKGFLAPRYQQQDMVHANPDYGALVVDRMVSIAAHHASRGFG